MYPLTLIRLSRRRNISLELKDRQVVTGYLVKCDVAMNMHLQNVTVEKVTGEKLFISQCFLKGQNVKFVRIESKVLGMQHLFD